MKIGYARVSTRDQNLALQVQALEGDGCERIYKEVASGAKTARPVLEQMLEHLRPGDQIVIWKLDRIGRSLQHLFELVGTLNERGVELKVLTGGIDTSTSTGRLVFSLFAALAEYERELIVERTRAGLQAARARGRVGGRPRKLSDKQIKTARFLLATTDQTLLDIAEDFGVSKSTVARRVQASIQPTWDALTPKDQQLAATVAGQDLRSEELSVLLQEPTADVEEGLHRLQSLGVLSRAGSRWRCATRFANVARTGVTSEPYQNT